MSTTELIPKNACIGSQSRPIVLQLLVAMNFLLGIAGADFGATCRAADFSEEEANRIVVALDDPSLDPAEIKALLMDKRNERYHNTISLNVDQSIPITASRYAHFTEPFAINKLKKFCSRWKGVLDESEKRFNIDSNIASAILLVETGLGKLRGQYLTIGIFSSLFLDTAAIIKSSDYQNRPPAERDKIERKNAWALSELKASLKMAKEYGFNLLRLRGSFAGAFGLSQFLPSSYLNFAVSHSKQILRPDLFSVPDAIFSTANFLKAHGLSKSATLDEKRAAIWSYNHSEVYVDTILQVADAISIESSYSISKK